MINHSFLGDGAAKSINYFSGNPELKSFALVLKPLHIQHLWKIKGIHTYQLVSEFTSYSQLY